MRKLLLLAPCIVLVGCNTGTVTNSDAERVRSDFSQENYEKAMKAAGKEAELQKEKEQAAARGDQ